jgi:thiamine-monophosphate kinase
MPKPPSREYALLRKLAPYLQYRASRRYPVGVGDDAAVRQCGEKEQCVLTADTCVEDIHFSLRHMSLVEVGYKCMVVNLSDCAAMGARPDGAVVQVVFPGHVKGTSTKVRRLYQGMHEACRKWRFPIVGGDLSGGPCWIVAVTLLGRMGQSTRPLRRKGARHGDLLWMTGRPGEAAAGLAALQRWGRKGAPSRYASLIADHVRPVPRLAAGEALAAHPEVHAAMDLSDGLSKDCATLCWESGVGAILELNDSAVSSPSRELSTEIEADWRQWALHGGEDYELLFAAQASFDPLSIAALKKTGCTLVGCMNRTIKGVWEKRGGRRRRVKPGGWDHVV